MSIPTHPFPLHMRPRLVQCGLCLHGAKATESHCQNECWSLHFYHYAGTMRTGCVTYPFHSGCVSLIPPKREVEWKFPPHASHYYAHFKCGTSTSRSGVQIPMIRLFQQEFQCGAKEYIRRARVRHALNLLCRSSLSIKSIAMACGFCDLAYFNKIIRRETGYSPRNYRIKCAVLEGVHIPISDHTGVATISIGKGDSAVQ